MFKAEIENHRSKRRERQYDSLVELRTNKKLTKFVASVRDAGGFPERLLEPVVGSETHFVGQWTGMKAFTASQSPVRPETCFDLANRVTHLNPVVCMEITTIAISMEEVYPSTLHSARQQDRSAKEPRRKTE